MTEAGDDAAGRADARDSIWSSPQLRPLVVSRLFNGIAEWTWYTGATVYAFTLAGVGGVGAIGIAAVLPAAVLAPALGYVIDRLPRERVLVALLLLRFLAITVGALSAAFFPSVPVLVVASAFEGIALFIRPTTAALLPSITRRPADLVRGYAVLGFLDNAGVLIGPVCGGLLLAASSPAVTFATAAGLAFGALAAALRVRVVGVDVRAEEATAATGLRHAFTEALRGARAVLRRDVRSVTAITLLAAAFGGASEVFVVPLAIDVLHWGEAGPGLLMASTAGGGLLAGLLLGRIGGRRLGPWFIVATATIGGALALIAAAPTVLVVLAASVAFGAGSELVMTSSLIQVQSLVPAAEVGRVLGTIEGVGFLACAGGVAVTTHLLDTSSLRTSLFGLAAVAAVGAVVLAWALLRADGKVAVARERVQALDGIALFAPLPNVLRERIATQIARESFAAGDVITYQGEYGDDFYVVQSGELEVMVGGHRVGSLGSDDFFGEAALTSDSVRTATVRAVTDCRLWVLPRTAFLSVLIGFAATERVIAAASTGRRSDMLPARRPTAVDSENDDAFAAFTRVPLFTHLSDAAVRTLASSSTTARYDACTVVFTEHDRCREAYFIVEGEVEFDRAGECIRTLGPGSLFGERTALRVSATRSATATAAPGTVLLRIPGEHVRSAVMGS